MKKNIAVTYLFLLLCPSYSKSNVFYSKEYTPFDNLKANNTAKKAWNNEWVGGATIGQTMKFNAAGKFIPTPKGNYVKYGVKQGLQKNAQAAISGVKSDVVNFGKGLMNPVKTGKSLVTSAGQFTGKVTGKGFQLTGKGLEKIGAKIGEKGWIGKGLGKGLKSTGQGLKNIGSKITQKLGKKVATKVAQRATVSAGARIGAAVAGRGLAAVTGVGTVIVGVLTAIDVGKALGEGIASYFQSRNCHKLCAAKVTQYARDIKTTGYITWNEIVSEMIGDVYGKDGRFCQCEYIGRNQDLKAIQNQKFYLDQLKERGPLGKIYKEMCKEGQLSGNCNPMETSCLLNAPRACMYLKADD